MKQSEKSAEIVGWAQRRVDGHLPITALQMLILRHLKVAKDAGCPLDTLDAWSLRRRSLTALVNRDWIYEARIDDQIRYGITVRGERELRFYECPVKSRRTDGLCPNCGERPKHVSSTGRVYSYCYECEKAYKKRQRELGRPRIKLGRRCSMCKQRPVHVGATGHTETYCKACLKKKRRESRQRKHSRQRAMIAAGKPPRCCKCDQPVHYTERSIYDYCQVHLREYMNSYNRRRRGYAQ